MNDMNLIAGIDIGTSGAKVMVLDDAGKVYAEAKRSYRFDSPINGYAEQDADTWTDVCFALVREALDKLPADARPEDILGIAFSGQMHGVVMLDENFKQVRPAILHCDARSGKQVAYVNQELGAEMIRNHLLNPVYSGFMLCSLLWVRDNEPENLKKIRYVMSPKDYVKFCFCGKITTDYSDASATLLFDMQKADWSDEIISRFGFDRSIFPECGNSDHVVGKVTAQASELTGLSTSTSVCNGGADQVMQAIGAGTVSPGQATSNIGTSGQVCFQCDHPIVNPNLNTNCFIGYDRDHWYTMGATMSAGLCHSWFMRVLGSSDFEAMNQKIAEVPAGSGGLIFLPYLTGERCPHLNTDLTGTFFGLQVNTGDAEMCRAVMEGVSYSLLQCMEICGSFGLTATEIVASGGGARGTVWPQIQADIYGIPVKRVQIEEQACVGAAIAAGSGVGLFENIEDGCRKIVKYKDLVFTPNAENHAKYQEYFALFKQAYQVSRPVIEEITRLGRRS